MGIFEEYKNRIDQDITNQEDPNTIPPETVGKRFKELADITKAQVAVGPGIDMGIAIPSMDPGELSGPAKWDVIEPGTYTHFGSVILLAGNRGQIYYDGATFELTQASTPQPQNKIQPWSATPNSSGDQRTHISQIWQANADTLATDVPGTSPKWTVLIMPADNLTTSDPNKPLSAKQGVELGTRIGEFGAREMIYTKRAESMTLVSSSILYQTSIFSSWGCINPPVQNFNAVRHRIKSFDGANLITKVRTVIRENNSTGTVLADKTIDVTFVLNVEKEVEIILDDYIANEDNLPLWISYITNGRASLRGKNPVAGSGTKYGTTMNILTEPSTVSVGEDKLIYTEFYDANNKLVPGNEYSGSLYQKFDDEYGISGAGLAKESLIKDPYQTENKFSTGNGSGWTNESSTFTGWGQILPVTKNFNGAKFPLRYWDATAPITQVRVLLRESDRFGDIITEQLVPFSADILEEKDVIITFENFENEDNHPIWVEFTTNGKSGRKQGATNPAIGSTGRYRTTANAGTTFADGSADDSGDFTTYFELGIFEEKVMFTPTFLETAKDQLGLGKTSPSIVDIVLPSELYVVQGLESNIFFKNAVIPKIADRLDNYYLDLVGEKGFHFERGHRFTPVLADVGSSNLTLSVYNKDRLQLVTKTTKINVPAITSGTGVTRKVLIIGDSTVDGGDITVPLKAYFDSDAMDVVFLGTRGAVGVKHEGYAGWTINDIATFGRTLFRHNVAGIPAQPSLNDEYTNNGSRFKVVEINITAGTGYFSTERVAGTNDPILTASTLTKFSGSGAATINYTSSSVETANPFWNATTSKFDLQMYLTNTGQTIGAGDWVFFQFGINDVFQLTGIPSADQKAELMWSQLNDIMNQVQLVSASIRIGIIGTIPPCSTQDGFGENYKNGQTKEMYFKTGWISWHRKLLSVLDTPANKLLKRYLVGAHLNLDTDYNMQTVLADANARNSTNKVTMIINGVHPDDSGNKQIADSYAGIIKHFG